MDKVFYGIADIFNWIFKILPHLGRPVNIIFIAIGFIGTYIWIAYGPKYKEPTKKN
jgi:hypothetical protein